MVENISQMKTSIIINSKKGAVLAGLLFSSALAAQAQNPVTFQVDMSAQVLNGAFTNGSSSVSSRGTFNNYGNSPGVPLPLTNNPALAGNASNLYSGTLDIPDALGTVEQYKFVIDPGGIWESPSSTCNNNRTFTLAGGAQTLPVVYFSDTPLLMPTNDVVFQVDMTAQIDTLASFTPGSSHIYARGSFESGAGWGTDNFELTNNPSLSGNASNVYSGLFRVPGVPGACGAYKFYIDTGANWESPASTGGNNRSFNAASGPQTLPLVYFNDASPGDFLPVDTTVTFNVSMTNAASSVDGTPFNPAADHVYLNGDFLSWWAWGPFPPSQYELTNNPVGSLNYSLEVTRPLNTTLPLTYKYSINGADNEAGVQTNHFRYVRQTPSYSMPLDTFGTNAPPIVENYPGFGQLGVGIAPANKVAVSWLGRPGVHLQTKSDLSGGAWTDLYVTDGTNWTAGYSVINGFLSVTNYPAGGSSTYYRLVKP